METKSAPNSSKKLIIVGAIIIAVLLAVIVFLALRPSAEAVIKDGEIPKIGYAAEAKAMLDENTLQAAIDEAMANAQNDSVGLKYKNDAYSEDGQNFECYIVNSDANIYDMFLTIYADSELTDQIFLSGLVRPGSGFDHITLEHALDTGDHTVYVALTQVDTDEETGEQVIKGQVMHTMTFHVVE